MQCSKNLWTRDQASATRSGTTARSIRGLLKSLTLAAGLVLFAQSASAAGNAEHAVPATLRVDLVHSGNALSDSYALERVVVEPLPWPGNMQRTLDTSNRGNNMLEVADLKTGKLLYTRGYSTVFGEWSSTDEASKVTRAFSESLRFPKPSAPVRVRILKRDERNQFSLAWSVTIDPDAQEVIRKHPASPAPVLPIHVSGSSPDKVDLLVLGDGYSQKDMAKFESDVKRLVGHLFEVSPFKEHERDFNVWAMAVPTPESGVSRPSTNTYRASALSTRYDIFGSERYILTLDNRALRDIAQYAPYEFIEILVNNETYGGGGIFGQFSTAAASNDWANYLFVHEFGHHFAGLADEYYTSPVAYQPNEVRTEPWEPNVTALRDPQHVKWAKFVKPGTALPTPWPKTEYDEHQREYQKRRAALRAQNRPESEMSQLFREDLEFSAKLFSRAPNAHAVGAFEGANYEATGYYRPQQQCIMFDRSEQFCKVCSDAIITIIDLYTGAESANSNR